MAQSILAGKRILAVDDEPKMTRFIRMNLELEGYRVSEAFPLIP